MVNYLYLVLILLFKNKFKKIKIIIIKMISSNNCKSNKKLCVNNDCKRCFEKSFASSDKSIYWSIKNENISSRDVFKKSNKKYYFDCNICNHLFCISLNDVNSGYWCSYCCNPPKNLCDDDNCKLCFDKSFASSDKSVYWSIKNKNVKPRDVFKKTNKTYYFDCHVCNHSFNIMLSNIITNNSWCSYCTNKKLCNDNDCEICFEKSFASSDKNIYWSKNNENISPRDVFKVSEKKYNFNCNMCNHSFYIRLSDINNGHWCSYCSNKKLCDNNDCEICFKKSFMSSDKSVYWSIENKNVKPRDVFKQSNKKYYFDCNICKHSFEITLNSIINNNSWCSYCSNNYLCKNNDCEVCFEKSFASSDKSIYWSIKNENIKPRDIFKQSNKKYYFDCNVCKNSFDIKLNKVKNGHWCKFCRNKTEKKIFEKLKLDYLNLKMQFKSEWCKKKLCLPYDFCIPELKIIIELDGPQHFKQISNWSSPKLQFENDKYKEKCANNNNYSIIRILQEDVYYDKHNWYEELVNTIEKIKKNKNIINVYLCKNNEYSKYKNNEVE
jgi:very-short-patch-repair endonuclease